MFRLMLNSHPNLAVPFESAFLRVHDRLAEFGDLREHAAQKLALQALSEERMTHKGGIIEEPEAILSHHIESFADLMSAALVEYTRRQGKQRWGIKTPDYLAQMDRLWQLFPGCRFIHLIRDGRDVALSLRSVSWGSSHMPTLAADWHRIVTLGYKMGAMIGAHYLEVRYEDLILDPTQVLMRVCAFLEEPYHDSMLSYHLTGEQEMPVDSMQWHASSVTPPMAEKVFAWKSYLSVADQILFEEIAGPTLERFGYELCGHEATLRSRVKRFYYDFLKRW